jgi:hypothetical protein
MVSDSNTTKYKADQIPKKKKIIFKKFQMKETIFFFSKKSHSSKCKKKKKKKKKKNQTNLQRPTYRVLEKIFLPRILRKAQILRFKARKSQIKIGGF